MGYTTFSMADICEELQKQLHELDVLRKSCGSLLLREGMESDAAKKTIEEFDTLAEHLRDEVAFYRQPYSEHLDILEKKIDDKKPLDRRECGLLYGVDRYPGNVSDAEKVKRYTLIKKRTGAEKKEDLKLALEELTPPREIDGDLDLGDLTSAEGLILPEEIGGDLWLNSLTSAEGLILPEEIGGNLWLNSLTSAKGLTLPRKIGGTLDLSGTLDLNGLTSAEELTLPEESGGNLWLNGLTSAKGLTLPRKIGGDLFLNGLTSAEELTLPEEIGSSLFLSGLTSAEELTLPEEIGGELNLGGLTSTEGITNWPVKIRGIVKMNTVLPQEEKAKLEKRYPGQVECVNS